MVSKKITNPQYDVRCVIIYIGTLLEILKSILAAGFTIMMALDVALE